MLTERIEPQFSSGIDAPEVEDYRPVSLLAILAFLTAVLSLVAVIHPLLWVVPVLAVVLAAMALLQFARPESRYTGKWLAIVGLCLALGVEGYAVTRDLSRQQILYEQAEEFNRAWIALLLHGRTKEAHQLTLSHFARFKGPESLDDFYAGKTGSADASEEVRQMQAALPGSQLNEFLHNPAVARLLEMPPDATIRRVGNDGIEDSPGGLIVRQRFVAEYQRNGQPEKFEFRLQSRRLLHHEPGKADWQLGESVEAN